MFQKTIQQFKKIKMSTFHTNNNETGEFVRKPSTFRNWIKKDGDYKPESGRYHIFVSYACPWAHRTLVGRKIKGLEDHISYSTVDYFLSSSTGWSFSEECPDHVENRKFLKEYYLKSNPEYDGKITVPVLYDKKTGTIVNNESSEILRMLNSEFNDFAKYPEIDLYPEEHRKEIDEINEWIYDTVNNGVYKCGFAKSQVAYEKAYHQLFESLDKIEERLSKSRYLIGNKLTEADIRLWTTLIRFDPVYVGHFKTNKKRIIDYPNIYGYTRDIYQSFDIKDTVNMVHIKNHYYQSHDQINPTRIVPLGPDVDFSIPHNRDKQFQ